MEMALHGNAGALLGHLTEDQRRRLDALDAAYIDLMSSGIPDRAGVEALAEAIVTFHDEIAKSDVGYENRA